MKHSDEKLGIYRLNVSDAGHVECSTYAFTSCRNRALTRDIIAENNNVTRPQDQIQDLILDCMRENRNKSTAYS